MRSSIRNRPDRGLALRSRSSAGEGGFTLIEVLVALAIAGGALVLILSANNASLRRSADARFRIDLERAAETKLSEWIVGAEKDVTGELPSFEGHRWEIRSLAEPVASLRKLRRITLQVYGPGGARVHEHRVLRCEESR